MSEPAPIPTPEEAEEHFRRLLAEADLEQPDEVEYDPAAAELIFFWHEPKVAIVVELDGDGPVDVWPRADFLVPPV